MNFLRALCFFSIQRNDELRVELIQIFSVRKKMKEYIQLQPVAHIISHAPTDLPILYRSSSSDIEA